LELSKDSLNETAQGLFRRGAQRLESIEQGGGALEEEEEGMRVGGVGGIRCLEGGVEQSRERSGGRCDSLGVGPQSEMADVRGGITEGA
jgi:hypothetical protein